MWNFEGKRVIVTGGSRGIGASISRAFAERGAHVAILARDLERARAAAAEIGPSAQAWATDVADESAVQESFDAALEALGGVDVLVNNAGITRDKLLMQMRSGDWDEVMAANLRSCFLCSKAVLRPMLRQRAGRIINVTSVIGLTGNAGQANYAASKAGIVGYTKSLARELASRSITVNAVAPGMIDTDMTRSLPEAAREQILGQIPLGRLGSGAEVAGAVLFLASEASTYVTGEVLRVDGGMAM